MLILTVTCADNLHETKTMARSVKRCMPNAAVAVGLVEKMVHPEAANDPYFDCVVLAKDLNIPDFPQFLFKYRLLEGVTAVKPFLLLHLMNRYPEETHFVFLDSDMLVLHPFDQLDAALAEHSIIITSHHLEPWKTWDCHLANGIYNTGMLAVRRSGEAERFLRWWAERLYANCTFEDGLFVDQKWVELAVAFFDVHILKDPGYNVAFWNFFEHRRRICRSASGTYTLSGYPLCCFHFSGLDAAMPYWMGVFYPDSADAVHRLHRDYRLELERMGRKELENEPWSYDFFDSGEKIEMETRGRCRQQPELARRFADPFAESNGAF